MIIHLHSVWKLQTYSLSNIYSNVQLQANLNSFYELVFKWFISLSLDLYSALLLKASDSLLGLCKIHCHWNTFEISRIKLLEMNTSTIFIQMKPRFTRFTRFCYGFLCFVWRDILSADMENYMIGNVSKNRFYLICHTSNCYTMGGTDKYFRIYIRFVLDGFLTFSLFISFLLRSYVGLFLSCSSC